MKAISLISLGALLVSSAFAQTTNRVQAAIWFREVDGKLYNAKLSTSWHTLDGKCSGVKTNGIILQTFTTNNVYETWRSQASGLGGVGAYAPEGANVHRRLISSTVEPNKRIFIRNFKSAADGQSIRVSAMQIGTIETDGNTLELWDCGLPHFVDVVQTNSAAVKP